MKLSSPAFVHMQAIPSLYTCEGKDVSPPLVFENVPSDVKSLALILDDPDAPAKTWVHWTVWNLSPSLSGLPEDFPRSFSQEKCVQGKTDFGFSHYGGPCPPSGTHRYFFKLYALDMMLDLGSDATKEMLENAMKSHILEQAELVGLYQRIFSS